MYESHHCFEVPASEKAAIWRYMTFSKFVSLLQHNSLYFANPRSFDDKFEGFAPESIINKWMQHDVGRKVLSVYNRSRTCFRINCWIENECEVYGMWKSYLPTNIGLAIVSNFSRLKDAFKDYSEPVYIGKVKYFHFDGVTEFDDIYEYYRGFEKISTVEGCRWNDLVDEDFSAELCVEPFPSLPPILMKRNYFKYESEVRAVIVPYSTVELAEAADDENNGFVCVDLEKLIERIVISPTAPTWFLEMVRIEVQNYGINVEVTPSDLDASPTSAAR